MKVHEYWWNELKNVGFPKCSLPEKAYPYVDRPIDLKLSSPRIHTMTLIFRSPFQIMNWKLLPAASAHWSWLCLLYPIWQPSSSFRWQNIFGLVHFGSGCIDTPMRLTSSGDVLWDYQSVWFKTRQASPNGLHLLFSLWWKRKTHGPS